VRGATRSPSAILASSAAIIGDAACRTSTRATVVWLRAMMKHPDATAMLAATPMPARPIDRKAEATEPGSAMAT
jgi:hypothetical protein